MSDKLKPQLVLTGDRKNRRYLVMIHGHPVWLSPRLFVGLCKLVLGRQRTSSGFVRIRSHVIHRLRKTISDGASEMGVDELIETGPNQEYRLSTRLRDVAIGEAFGELRHKKLLVPRDINLLMNSCRQMKHERPPHSARPKPRLAKGARHKPRIGR